MALHVITDTFAHGSYMPNGTGWERITHAKGADRPTTVPERASCAAYASQILIDHIINQETASVEDFYKVASNRAIFKGGFRLGNLSEYIKAISLRYYNLNRTEIDRMSYFEKIGKAITEL